MSTRHRTRVLWSALAFSLLLTLTFGLQRASAHERRELLGGKYQAVVGFLNEPAYDGQVNAVSIVITDLSQKDANGNGKPVEGLQNTLKVQLLSNGKTLDLPLKTRSGQAGSYVAYFEPTKAGQYRFHFTGQIEGQAIDETFESGPGRFDDVQALAPLQFPDPVPAAGDLRSEINTARMLGIGGLVVGLLGLAVAAMALLRRPAGATSSERVVALTGSGND